MLSVPRQEEPLQTFQMQQWQEAQQDQLGILIYDQQGRCF